MGFTKITKNVFAVGGSDLSNSGDAMSYLIKTKENKLVLIDCGVDSKEEIVTNIKETGNNPDNLSFLILTHCHIDHTGSAFDFKQSYPELEIIAHEWERETLEGIPGTEKYTAASWYGVKFQPIIVEISIKSEKQKLNLGGMDFLFIHTPGHTPGSMAIIIEDEGKKILFPHDVHGPFLKEFGSNINDWAKSMKILLSYNCDILAEGHYGIYNSPDAVKNFINSHLKQNGFK